MMAALVTPKFDTQLLPCVSYAATDLSAEFPNCPMRANLKWGKIWGKENPGFPHLSVKTKAWEGNLAERQSALWGSNAV